MKNFLLGVLFTVCVGILVLTDFGRGQEHVYDCRDAHWMPDFPPEVKRECAKMFKEELERQRKEELQKKLIHT